MCSFILLPLSSLSQKKQVGVKYFKLIPLRVNFVCVLVLSKLSIVSILPFSVSCSFLRQFRLIVFSKTIFMKNGFAFHKQLWSFVLIFTLEKSLFLLTSRVSRSSVEIYFRFSAIVWYVFFVG